MLFYPELVVSCHPEDHQAEQFINHPTLIIELLSDSTEVFDRGVKFASERLLGSLNEYVLVDIKARRLECYRRTAENEWLLHDGVCEFKSLEISVPMEEIFEDVDVD